MCVWYLESFILQHLPFYWLSLSWPSLWSTVASTPKLGHFMGYFCFILGHLQLKCPHQASLEKLWCKKPRQMHLGRLWEEVQPFWMETKSLCTAHQICLLAQNMTRRSHVCRLVWIQSSCRRPRKPRWSAGRRQMAATAKNCRTTRASRWVWCRRCSVVYTVSFVDSPNTTQSTQLDLQFCFFYTGFSKLPHCLLITKQLMLKRVFPFKIWIKNTKKCRFKSFTELYFSQICFTNNKTQFLLFCKNKWKQAEYFKHTNNRNDFTLQKGKEFIKEDNL